MNEKRRQRDFEHVTYSCIKPHLIHFCISTAASWFPWLIEVCFEHFDGFLRNSTRVLNRWKTIFPSAIKYKPHVFPKLTIPFLGSLFSTSLCREAEERESPETRLPKLEVNIEILNTEMSVVSRPQPNPRTRDAWSVYVIITSGDVKYCFSYSSNFSLVFNYR